MALASLTVDLTLALSKFEQESGRATQIVTRDAEKMARATDKADAAIRRYTESFGRVGIEAKVISSALAGASDAALKLFANVDASGKASEARILALADKVRQVRDQASKLTAGAVAENKAGTLSDDDLKQRLAGIRAVQRAELDRIATVSRAEADASAEVVSRQKAAAQFLAQLNERASAINPNGTQKAQSQLLAEKAALLGVGKEAEAALAKIALLDGKTGQLGRSAFASRNQLLTLQYTISDVIASAGTGISPLTILLQQGPQLAQVEGGISGIFRTAVSLITPFKAAMAVAGSSIAAVGFAWYKGAEQSKAFNDAIVLSGNFAGQTEGQFNNLTRAIAESGQVTAAAAREFGQALIATGEIGPGVFGQATRAATLYGQATGKTAKDVAQSFASMSQDAAKWAAEQNRSLNFVTAAQLELIKGLQDAGKSAEAQALVYELLNKRLQALEPNLGTLDRAIRVVTGGWSRFWDAAYDVGRAETLDDKLSRARKALDQARAEVAAPAPRILFNNQQAPAGGANARLAAAQEAVKFAEAAKSLAENTAAAEAATAKLNKQAIDGRGNVESLLKGAKAASEYRKELDKLNRDIEANAKAGTPFTAAEEKIARAELKKRFTDKGAVKEANDERKAELEKDLQVFSAALAKEKDALKFQQDELKAIYDAGNLALTKFYDDREATIKRGTLAELNEQANAIGRIGEELKRGDLKKDERTKLERQLAEAQAKASDIQRDADNAAALATYDRAAAVKALTREVENFEASLKDLQGDPLGAAQLRAGQQIEAARTLAARAGRSDADVDAYAKAITLGNDFAEVQRKVGLATTNASRAEEAYLLRASTGRIGLVEQEQSIYKLRAAALVQLGELAEAAKRLAEQDKATDQVKAYAADLALQYAQAAQSVDPALNRLKANGDELGASLANVFGDAINNGRTFLDLVNNIGRTVTASVTKTLITEPLEQFLKGGISSIVQGSGPIGNLLQSVVGVSGGTGAAAQATTLSLSQLTLAATQASLALQSIAGSSAASTASTSGAGLFGWIGGLFGGGGGGGGLIPGGVGAVPYHTGGLVGQGGAARAVSSTTFAGAQKYHGGGTVGLGTNEVPAILMGGPRGMREEVLHASDPRHRDNMGQALLRAVAAGAFASGQGQARARPVLRYHSGGVAGMAPDEAWGGGRSSSARNDRRGGDTYNITLPPGTSRETASQIGARMAQAVARANSRNN